MRPSGEQSASIPHNGGVFFVVALGTAWTAIVIFSAAGWNPTGIPWNFTNTGQLGDSFGVLSAAMAAIAAYFAFRTYRSARHDSARLERTADEQSFLNLLERRYDVLDRVRSSQMKLSGGAPQMVYDDGQQALDRLALSTTRSANRSGLMDVASKYSTTVRNVAGLPNLFRFTYHIISFANRQFSTTPVNQPMVKTDPAYQFVRLLRAQMSDSELMLLALNCAHGEGREKFKALAERYALFHNMNPHDIERFQLFDQFEPEAFGLEPKDREHLLVSASST